jgi:hypothetical protein
MGRADSAKGSHDGAVPASGGDQDHQDVADSATRLGTVFPAQQAIDACEVTKRSI